jgi:hypothetical protein
MALLAAEALGFGDGDAGNADFMQRLFHFIELEWLDDRFDFFHVAEKRSEAMFADKSQEIPTR